MTDLYILCEKASACKNYQKALGGLTGTFEGQSYRLGHSHGHLMTFVEPEDQVSDEATSEKLKSWTDMDAMPWNLNQFNWKKTYIKSRNPKTKRMQSTKADIDTIKRESANCKALVIATDDDPSGEGDLLGWEIVNAIGWKKPVYRMRAADETPSSIKKALHNKKDVTDQFKQGEYLKGDARSKFDFGSMQLTRIGTYSSRQKGYGVKVVRIGRLKSAIIRKVYDQLQAVKNYVKRPYYEVRYKDADGHVYKRKFVKDESDFRIEDQAKAKQDLANYTPDEPTDVKVTRKKTAPGSLVDLSRLSTLLGRKGFKSKNVTDVYQLMYQDGVVSYPRTEDKKITQEQFDELLPLVDKIATVVGVDKSLLTHRTLRSKHMAKHAAHGANRPGVKVPASLSSLDKYDRQVKGAKPGLARAIYDVLAHNFLAILGEDYEYDSVTASLKNHPDFKTSFNVPVAMNYKDIFFDDRKKKSDDDPADAQTTDVLDKAEPFLYTGSNTKPSDPTQGFVMSFLEKNDIGTGATRVSTYSALLEGPHAELKEGKGGKLTLTDEGLVNAVLLDDTYIASPDITKKLFDAMDEVGKLKRDPKDIINMLNTVIKHDKPILLKNGDKLAAEVGTPKKSLQAAPMKDKIEVTFNGKKGRMSAEWGGHKFTKDEIQKLENGEHIVIQGISKAGKPYQVEGHLGQSSYKGHKFIGFIKDKFV